MGILALKAWRDVKSMKLRGLGIVVATGFWVAFYGGYYMGGESATYSARKIAHDLDLADLQVFITPSTAGEIPAFDDLPGIQVVQKRLFDTGTVERKDGGMLPVYVIYDAALNEAPVNRVEVLEGVLPGRDEQVENGWQVLVDRTMASVHKFGVGDRVLLTLHGVEEEARITGIALTAEFLYPSVDPSILMPAAGSLGILFSPMERIEALFGYPLYNNLSFRFAPLAAKPEIKERILERLTGSGIDIEAVIPREESPDHKIIEGFYRNGYEFGPIFMTLIGLGVFVIFGIYVYRMVEDRRTDIGILLALGSGRLPVAGYVAGVVFSFVLMGCLAGYPLSFLLSRVLAVSFAKPLNLPHHSFVFLPALPLKGTAICLLVCLAVVGIVCLRLWRLTPQEALRGGLPGLRGAAVPAFRPSGGRRNLFFPYALRGLWRRPGLTSVTIVTVAFALSFSASLNILMTSFGFTVRGFYEEDPWNLTASFQRPLSLEEVRSHVPLHAAHGFEGFLTGLGTLAVGGTRDFGRILGLSADSGMKSLRWVRGGGFSGDDAPEIVLNRNHWRGEPLRVGQRVFVETPHQRYPLELVGLVDEITIGAKYAYLPIRTAQRILDLDGKFSGIWVASPDASETAWRDLSRSGAVKQVTSKDDFGQVLERYLWEMKAGARSVLVITMFLAPFFLFASLSLWMVENEYDFVMFRVMGFRKNALWIIVLVQAVTIGVLGLLMSIPLSFLGGMYLIYKNTQIYLYSIRLAPSLSDFHYTIGCFVLFPVLAWFFSGRISRINVVEKLTRRPA